MKFSDSSAAIAAVILALSASTQASHSHLNALDKRHSHHKHKKAQTSPRVDGLAEVAQDLKKRGSCTFPTNAGLVPVTPGSLNAGWAQAPDMPCKPGHYCPYACPSGQLMAQWCPTSTAYVYPGSQYGGLYCDENGDVSKPFPNKPYCYEGVGTVEVINNCGEVHAVCQTVLPGYEDMLIPTEVESTAMLAVPGTDYWASTAAHYYHNPPGVTIEEGCIWGDGSQAIGNWAPYVSGANQDANGNTFVKIAWNPIWLDSNFAGQKPDWGMKITCDPPGSCNGLPCSIDPSVVDVNQVTSSESASGAGGGNFCVVTAPKGSKAYITVFKAGDSNSSNSKPAVAVAAVASTSPAPSPSPAPPTSSQSSTSSSTSSSTTSSSTSSSSSSSSSSYSPSTTPPSSHSSKSASSTTSFVLPSNSNAPHVLFENYTSTANTSSVPTTSSTTSFGSANAVTTSPSAAATTKNAAPGMMVSSETIGFSAFLAIAAAYFL